MTSPGRQDGAGRSRHLQLPNENLRIFKDDPLLNKHSPIQRQLLAGQPVRPQTDRRMSGKPKDSHVSPRHKIPSSPARVASCSAAVIMRSRGQCKSARANFTGLLIPATNELESEKPPQRPASSPTTKENEGRFTNELPQVNKDLVPQFLFPINTRAREHIEIKACLLAHTHHIDVDELQRIRGNNQLALNKFKMQRIISRGGAFSVDGSLHEEAKRKTTFLLRHFFTLQDSCVLSQITARTNLLIANK
ncbi:unnamed protein product [Phytophthora fragariaefolia]|uniref:Unnamed protein product n=1 Tax=Phytophthora fragariaefolia TaxID=1490495 RepID=A0A9W7D126_9STRA|nr:unnamed protein product [Phytophthora fragariaefolia]